MGSYPQMARLSHFRVPPPSRAGAMHTRHAKRPATRATVARASRPALHLALAMEAAVSPTVRVSPGELMVKSMCGFPAPDPRGDR